MENQKSRVCNMCGRTILQENGIFREDYIAVKKSWGYFSKKDGITSSFVLCETCCDALTRRFKVPVSVTETTELV
ncbi:MAG: hypothetical protein ACI39Q_05935 [Wujia sp.]